VVGSDLGKMNLEKSQNKSYSKQGPSEDAGRPEELRSNGGVWDER